MEKRLPIRRGILIAWILTSCLIGGCQSTNPSGRQPIPVRVVQTGILKETEGLRYSANIDAITQVTLAFKSGGYVDRIVQRKGADGRMRILQTGDRVSQGEVLAHVQESDYVDRVNSAKAQVDQAQANFDKAKLDFERAANLFKSDSYTKVQYDAMQASLDSATASVENAKASWQQARTALADCSVRSPLTGWVLSRNVEVGALAGTGSQAFVLADTHLVKAVFGVPDNRVSYARLGSPQTITTTSLEGEFHGRITSISPSADPKSRVFSVEVTVPNSENKLKPGMIATLTLGTSTIVPPTIAVPLSAVVRSTQHADGFAVFVVSDQAGKAVVHERAVEIGDTVGNMIAVKTGLKAGEPIVSTGGTLVRDGDEIKVIP